MDLSGYVQSINGIVPDKNGNVEITMTVPEGGGAKEWKLITDVTIAQEDASVTLFLDKDSNGNAFSCEEVSIKWVGIAVTDGTQSGNAWISINPTSAGYNRGKNGYKPNDYFYYTSQPNYSRVQLLGIQPNCLRVTESTSSWVSASDETDIHSLEISGYQQKSFYGRVIVYGR